MSNMKEALGALAKGEGRHVATFSIDMRTIWGAPELVRQLLQDVLIVEAVPRADPQVVDYTAFSPGFDFVPYPQRPPQIGVTKILQGATLVALEFSEEDRVAREG